MEVRHGVKSLDGRSIVYTHLLHHAVEEVFLLGRGALGEDQLKVVHESGDQFTVYGMQVKPLALSRQSRPLGVQGRDLCVHLGQLIVAYPGIEGAGLERLEVATAALARLRHLRVDQDKLAVNLRSPLRRGSC